MSKEGLSVEQLRERTRELREKRERALKAKAEQGKKDGEPLEGITAGNTQGTTETGNPEVKFEPWEEPEVPPKAEDAPVPTPDPVEASATPESTPTTPPEQPSPDTSKAPEAREDKSFKDKIKDLLPDNFDKLTEARQLLVTRNIQARIVDIVREKGQTQYSEDKINTKGLQKLKSFFKIKEVGIKNAEARVFDELLTSEEGRKLIKSDLERLASQASGREVKINEKTGKPEIIFADPNSYTGMSREIANEFNTAANKFREMPYEWGQEKDSSRRKKYEKARAEYQAIRERILKLDARNMGEQEAVVKSMQMDNAIKFDQLLYTHPEVEKEFASLAETPTGKESAKGIKRLLTGGGGQYTGILGTGIVARQLAAAAGIMGAGTTAGIGAVLGAWRGNVKAKEELAKRAKDARRGKKDTSAEKSRVVDITLLSKGLHKMREKAEAEQDPEKKEKIMAKLSALVEHCRGEVSVGQINFGDQSSVLVNQVEFLENLNSSIALTELEKRDEELAKKIGNLISSQGDKIEKKISEKQKKFIIKNTLKGAMYGMIVAEAGYWIKDVGHQLGWWGGGAEHAAEKTPAGSLPKAGVIDRAQLNTQGDTIQKVTHDSIRTDSMPGMPKDSVAVDTLAKEKADAAIRALGAKPDSTHVDSLTHNAQDSLATKPDISSIVKPNIPVEAVPPQVPVMPSSTHEITSDFSIKLGENGVPKNLETAFNAIAANRMAIPADGNISEEFATKSLNMAANLVRLTEGKGVAGISAEDFGKAVSFKDGILEVKDHTAFNQMLDKLQTHAGGLWESGTLQGKGAAMSNIGNISNNRWLEIMHAEGMDKGLDGAGTGIIGHDGITSEKIGNFAESDLVKNAQLTPDQPVGSTLSNQETMESLRAKIDAHLAKPLEVRDMTPDTDTRIKIPDEIMAKSSTSGVGQAPENLPTGDAPGLEQNVYYGPDGVKPIPTKITQLGNGNVIAEMQMEGLNQSVTVEMLSAQAMQVNQHNLETMFPEEVLDQMQVMLKETPAQDLIESTTSSAGNESISKLSAYVLKLRELTGLEPKGKSLFFFGRNESTEDYINRALLRVAQMGQLDKVKL